MVLGSPERIADSAGTPSRASEHDVLNRGFSFRAALSLAFADISPIVALYAIFALGLFAAGPRFFWAFPIVLCGQLLISLVSLGILGAVVYTTCRDRITVPVGERVGVEPTENREPRPRSKTSKGDGVTLKRG